ncbi:hypothetical protein [Adhaeribacter soli]|uniref:Tissue inhibitor of metalloproteinase n=1 Tax=Adhaeribacter soli TaxID=2607655 RepID=A0A5N1IXG1_9BACT|nr:hypothetical protein [Adhaeribacter soli]KAA9332743.1 hypothetical protein F0P94_12110 [Adhaeribacter soli]
MKQLIIICAFLFASSNCYACFCNPKPEIIYKHSPFIFIGKVISIKIDSTLTDNLGQPGMERVEFEVKECWKGFKPTQSNKAMLLQSINFRSNCASFFELNKTYLVAAKPNNPTSILSTDVCMGTALVSESKSFLAYLDTIPSYSPSIKYEQEINKIKENDSFKETSTGTLNLKKLAYGSLILNMVLLLFLIINYTKRKDY